MSTKAAAHLIAGQMLPKHGLHLSVSPCPYPAHGASPAPSSAVYQVCPASSAEACPALPCTVVSRADRDVLQVEVQDMAHGAVYDAFPANDRQAYTHHRILHCP